MKGDGQADPIGVTNLLAKAAKEKGVKIFEKSPVQKILVKNRRIAGVKVNDQTIECEYIVFGNWNVVKTIRRRVRSKHTFVSC